MRPSPRTIPGLADRLDELMHSLDADASPRNVMRVAEALWLDGSADRAVGLLEPLVRSFPASIAPRVLLAWSLEDCGRPDEGMRVIEEARSLDPSNAYLKKEKPKPPAHPVAAEMPPVPAIASARDPERDAEPESALTMDELREIPPSPLYSATLGEIFEKQGFDEKAIEIYREVVRLHPERLDLLARIESLSSRAAQDPGR